MKKFIIFFEEKEGTSAQLRLLDNFEKISVIHLVPGGEQSPDAWEPFDRHQSGRISLRNLRRCLNMVFGEDPIDFERLNRIYTKKSIRALEPVKEGATVIGFKTRYYAPGLPRVVFALRYISKRIFWKLRGLYHRAFARMIIDVLKKNNVVTFVAVRQDVLRWGLSKYHGDGSGQKGHMQFKLATGEISQGDIGKIHVDTERLEQVVKLCERKHVHKRLLFERLKSAGIEAYPLLYEDFLEDKERFFTETLSRLGLQTSPAEIKAALGQGAVFKKVHSDDISSFVENHEEVKEKFANRFVSWR